jgi:predicted AlkP superfamily pyrophosphatase or phosphodiesterase
LKLLALLLAVPVGACGDDTSNNGSGGSSGPDSATASGGTTGKLDAASGAGGATAAGGASGAGGAVKLDASTADATQVPDVPVTVDGPRDGGTDAADVPSAPAAKVIIFVWDGLRPDSVTAQNTPNLAKLRDQTGVNFTDNHAVFPTFTMMNGAAFATGSYPATHGFYGNTEYQPGPTGTDSAGKAVNFSQPIFTEDWAILHDLDNYYVGQNNSALFLVDTLFQAAHHAGLKTAAVGKSGPAFLQDFREDGSGGVILDENMAFPKSFASALLSAGLSVPANTVNVPYDGGAVSVDASNGNPTGTTGSRLVTLSDGVTSDPRATLGSPHDAKNEYMMGIYTSYILPKVNPDLSLIWFRNPDSTEHTFGPGSPNYVDALKDQDKLLGQLQAKLVELGLDASTDVIVVSDHGHSLVAGDPNIFPLRGLDTPDGGPGAVGAVDPQGYSVSGDVRTADLLTRAGFAHVYDGVGCTTDPVLSGIKANGTPLYPLQADDATGTACGRGAGFKYNTGSFVVPSTVPTDAVIIAANGGSDYLYVPSHDATLVTSVVAALQQRKQYGAIFVRSTYGAVPGTLSLKDIKVEGTTRDSPPTPDIIVSFDWNDTAVTGSTAGLPGTEYESAQNNRGMHGSFSPIDVHNTLIASGPNFKVAYQDAYPTGNVDVAPTTASLLGLSLPQANGRVLKEALRGQTVSYTVTSAAKSAGPVTVPKVCNPDDLACATPAAETTYSMTLSTKTIVLENNVSVTYFDKAKATRQ